MPRIPKILHYMFGMGGDSVSWSLVHHVCVMSAIKQIRPDAIYFYSQFEPSGPWWNLTKPAITLVPIVAPLHIFGRPLLHPAHKSDVVRLEKLIEHGGMYLDVDVLVQRSFDDLLDHSVVMGQEGEDGTYGIANSVILAEPKAPFLMRWYDQYRSFRGVPGQYWSEHSVELPGRLAKEHSEEVKMLSPKAFFWPMWSEEGLRLLFDSSEDITRDECYANHLWESRAWKYLDHLTPGQVRAKDTNFHLWARPYIEGLPDSLGGLSLANKTIRLAKKTAKRLLKK